MHKTKESVVKESVRIVEEACPGDDSNDEWCDAKRTSDRVKRLQGRRPTGHPGISNRLVQLRQELAARQSSDDANSSNDTSDNNTVEKHGDLEPPGQRHPRQPVVNPASRRKARLVMTPAALNAEDDDWADRHQERAHRISSRHPTGHPLVGTKAAQLLRQLQSLKRDDDSEDDDQVADVTEFEQVQPRRVIAAAAAAAASSKQKTSFRSKKSIVSISPHYDEGSGDEAWEKRARERSVRIRERRPTGHPDLGKRVAELAASLATVSNRTEPQDTSNDEQEAVSRPQSRSHQQIATSKPRSMNEARQPKSARLSNPKKNEVSHQKPKITRLAVNVDVAQDGDDSWEDSDRQKNRNTRIKARKATAHINLGGKVQELLAELAGVEENPDNEGLPPARRSQITCSSNNRCPKERPTFTEENPVRTKQVSRSRRAPRFDVAPEQEAVDIEWAEAARRAERMRKLKARKPTGHPVIGKKLKEFQEKYEQFAPQ